MTPLLALRSASDADQVALGVGELADYQACRRPFGTHLAFAAQALGFGQGGLDVGHADVEDDVARVGVSGSGRYTLSRI